MSNSVKAAIVDIAELQAINAELLKALKGASSFMKGAIKIKPEWDNQLTQDQLVQVNAAIAKARRKA